MKRLFYYSGYILSFVWPRIFADSFTKCKNLIYTGWISRQFKSFKGKAQYKVMLHEPAFISIGQHTLLYKRARLACYSRFNNHTYSPEIIIGDNCAIGSDCFLSCIDKIQIGNNVAVTARTLILDNVHGDFNESHYTFNNNDAIPDVFLGNAYTRELSSKGPIIIEDNVHIGENCTILSGVTIGHNSVISANTVVFKNIPPYSIVSGNPGKVLITFGK